MEEMDTNPDPIPSGTGSPRRSRQRRTNQITPTKPTLCVITEPEVISITTQTPPVATIAPTPTEHIMMVEDIMPTDIMLAEDLMPTGALANTTPQPEQHDDPRTGKTGRDIQVEPTDDLNHPIGQPTITKPTKRPRYLYIFNKRLKVRHKQLDHMDPFNGSEWINRNIFLNAITPMKAVNRDIEYNNSYGQLWRSIMFLFLGCRNPSDFRNIRPKEFDHSIGRNFTQNAMREIYKLLAEANHRHGLPLSRAQRTFGHDPIQRHVTINKRPTYGNPRRVRWDPKDQQRTTPRDRPPRGRPIPFPSFNQWLCKFSKIIAIWHIATCLIKNLPVVTTATPQYLFKKLYLEDDILSMLDNVRAEIQIQVPITYLISKNRAICDELNTTAKTMSRDEVEMANLYQTLSDRTNTEMKDMGTFKMSVHTMTAANCSRTCGINAGSLPTLIQLKDLNRTKHTVYLDIKFNKAIQNIYSEQYNNLAEWKTDFFRLLNSHHIKLFDGTHKLISTVTKATFVAMIYLPANTIRFFPIDQSAGHCVCKSYRGANISKEIIQYLSDARLENQVFKAEIQTLHSEASQLLDQYLRTHSRVLTMAREADGSNNPSQRRKRNILSALSDGVYNLFGIASEHNVQSNTHAIQTTTNNVAIMQHYLQAKDKQTLRYRQKIDSVARTTQKELVAMTDMALYEHLELLVNNRRLFATHNTGSFRTQIFHLSRIANEYTSLTHGSLPQDIKFQYNIYPPSIELENIELTKEGVSFPYTYRRIMTTFKTRKMAYIPIAADKDTLVYYNPEELVVIPRFGHNNENKIPNTSVSATISLNDVSRSSFGYATTLPIPRFTPVTKSCTEAIRNSFMPSTDQRVKLWCNFHRKTVSRGNYTFIKQIDNVLFIASQKTLSMIITCDNNPTTQKRVSGITYSPIEPTCKIQVGNLHFKHSELQPPTILKSSIKMLVPDIIAMQHKQLYDETAGAYAETKREEIKTLSAISGISDEADLAGLGLTLEPQIIIGTAAGAGIFLLITCCCCIACICCPTFRVAMTNMCFCLTRAICCSCLQCANCLQQHTMGSSNTGVGSDIQADRPVNTGTIPRVHPRGQPSRETSRGAALPTSTQTITSPPILITRSRQIRDELTELEDTHEPNDEQTPSFRRRSPSAPSGSPSLSRGAMAGGHPQERGHNAESLPPLSIVAPMSIDQPPKRRASSADNHPNAQCLNRKAGAYFRTWRYSAYDDAKKILEINVPCLNPTTTSPSHLLLVDIRDGGHQKGSTWCGTCRAHFGPMCGLNNRKLDYSLLLSHIPEGHLTGKEALVRRLEEIRITSQEPINPYMAQPPKYSPY